MHLRSLVSVLVALLTIGLVAGCGGGDAADSSTDVNELLQDTFAGGKPIQSGKLDIALGVESDAGQPVTVDVTGPFKSQGAGRLPQLDLDVSFAGGGQTIKAGLTATENQAFVGYGEDTYEIAGAVFQQFKAGYEEAAKRSSGQNDQTLASLGIDPRRWLTNAKNEGEAKVGDTDTIKITGDVDVPKLLDDVNGALEKIRALGVQGSEQIPDKLTEAEKRQTAEAIDDLSVEIHTGAEDKILRRIVVTMSLTAPEGGGTVDVRFDLQLHEVNEDQTIEAPDDAKSFEELLTQIEGFGLGDLGALGGAAGGGDQPNVDEYADCVAQAAGDNEKVRKCADLLTTP
jgi:hypothetical protein